MTKLTYTLAIDHQPDRDGGVALELVDVDLDNLTAYERAVIDAIGIIAGAVLGLDRIDHPAAAAPQQVTDLAGTAERAPVVTAAPATDEDREYLRSPERLKNQTPAKKAAAKAGKATGPKSDPHAPGQLAAPGTKLRSILDVLADHGGRWEGTSSDLGAAAGCTHQSGPKMIRNLADAGLCTIERSGPRTVTAIALTGDGWAHLGRGKPTDIHSLVLTPPEPPATSDAPKVIDLATLPREGRKPFDPDAARAAAAGAL